MTNQTATITAFSSFKSTEDPLLVAGIIAPGCTWVFTYDAEEENLMVQWERKTPLRTSSPSSAVTIQVFVGQEQTKLPSSPHTEFSSSFLDQTGSDTFNLPRPAQLSSRPWLFFRITGPASVLGAESQNVGELDKALQEMDALRILIKNAADQAAEEIGGLKSALLTSETSVKELKQAKERLGTEKGQLAENLSGAERAREQLKEKVRAAEASIKKLETDKKNLEGQLDAMTNAKKKLELDLGTAQNRIKLLDGTVTNLEKRNRDAQLEVEAFNRTVTELNSKVQGLESTKKAVEKKLVVAERRGDTLYAEVQQLSSAKRTLESENSSLTESNINLSVEGDLLTQKNADLTKLVEEMEAKQSALINDARDAKIKQQSTAKELTRVQKQAETVNAQLEQETRRTSGLDSEIFAATQTIKDLEEDVKNKAEKQRQSDVLSKAQSTELAKISSKFRLEKARADNNAVELDLARQKVRDLEALERERVLQRVAYMEGRKEIEKRDKEIVDLKAEVEKLKTDTQELVRTSEEMIVTNSLLKEERDSLDSTNVQLQDGLDNLKKQHSQLLITKTTLERDKTKLTKSLDDSKAAFAREQQNSSSLDDQLFEANEKIKSMETEYNDTETQRKKAVSDLRNTSQDLAKTKSELTILRRTTATKIENLEKDIGTLKAQATKLTEDLYNATSRAEGLDEELSQSKAQFEGSERQLLAARQSIDQLRRELQAADERERNYDPDRLYQQLVAEKNGHAADNQRLNAIVDEQKELNTQKAKRIGDLEADIAARLADIQGLNGQIRNHLTNIAALNDKVQSQVRAIVQLETQLRDERAARNTLQATVNQQSSTITALQNQQQHDAWVLQGVRSDLSTAQSNLLTQQKVSQNLQSSLYSEQSVSSSLRNELWGLRNNYNTLSSNYSAAQNNLRQLSNDYTNLNNRASHASCVAESYVRKLVYSNNEKLDHLIGHHDRRYARGRSGWYRYSHARLVAGSYNYPGSIKTNWETDDY